MGTVHKGRRRGDSQAGYLACQSPRSPPAHFNGTLTAGHPEIGGANRSGRERANSSYQQSTDDVGHAALSN